jgi:hypothetical protein
MELLSIHLKQGRRDVNVNLGPPIFVLTDLELDRRRASMRVTGLLFNKKIGEFILLPGPSPGRRLIIPLLLRGAF